MSAFSHRRTTQETDISITVAIPDTLDSAADGNTLTGTSIETGIGFLDHMLSALAKHAHWKLAIKVHRSDLITLGDDHHLVEDIGIVLGSVLRSGILYTSLIDV
jgi:imidazoleglycerol-phosphate dehydratase